MERMESNEYIYNLDYIFVLLGETHRRFLILHNSPHLVGLGRDGEARTEAGGADSRLRDSSAHGARASRGASE